MTFDPSSLPWYIWLITGFLIGVGGLIALPKAVSDRITDSDNLGWLMLAAGVLLLTGWFFIPFFPVIWAAATLIWEKVTATMLIALVTSVLLIAAGAFFMRRRHP